MPKPGWAHFWGRSLDALVVMVAAGVLMAVLNSLVRNLAFGPLSFVLLDSTGLFAAALAAIWFVVLFAYGMVWGALGSVGDAAAGMRSVRISDGTTSGAWLGGWRCCLLVLCTPLSGSWRLPWRSAAETGTVSPQISYPLTAVPGWPEATGLCRIPRLRRCSGAQSWSTTSYPDFMATETRAADWGRTWLVRPPAGHRGPPIRRFHRLPSVM